MIAGLQTPARGADAPPGASERPPTFLQSQPPSRPDSSDADGGVRNAGVGLNAGIVMLRLSADRAVRAFGGQPGNQLADEAPTTIASFDLHETLFELAPAVVLGGDGFHFKVEAPLRQSATLRTYGVGVYPLNYGYFLPGLRLMPTLSAGAVLSYLTDRRTDAAGPLLETRVAVGLKFLPLRGLALSADIGRIPWAVGALRGSGPDWWRRADARGGIGDGWQFGLGVFWL